MCQCYLNFLLSLPINKAVDVTKEEKGIGRDKSGEAEMNERRKGATKERRRKEGRKELGAGEKLHCGLGCLLKSLLLPPASFDAA